MVSADVQHHVYLLTGPCPQYQQRSSPFLATAPPFFFWRWSHWLKLHCMFVTKHPPVSGVVLLTPSLPLLVKFPGCMIHRRAYKEYIFRSCNTSTFRATRFDKNPSYASAKKKAKRLTGLKFRTLVGRFQWHHDSEGVKSAHLTALLIRARLSYPSASVVESRKSQAHVF